MTNLNDLAGKYNIPELAKVYEDVMGSMIEQTVVHAQEGGDGPSISDDDENHARIQTTMMAFDAAMVIALCDVLNIDPTIVVRRAKEVLEQVLLSD